MEILFLMKYFEVGGQEVVTSVLADKFSKQGHHVVIASFSPPARLMRERLPKDISFYVLDGFHYSRKNIKMIRNILENHQIKVVINQWGLPYLPILLLRKACAKQNIKIVSVYHNDPGTNARLKIVEEQIKQVAGEWYKIILKIEWYIFRIATGISMHYVYNYSDRYMLLSQSFVSSFKRFAYLTKNDKVQVLPNPITISSSDFVFDFSQKRKEILYIGRLDENQKRIHRIIDTWALLEASFSDWKLTIVGDGVEKRNLVEKVIQLKLNNVSFEGFQSPLEYYKRASILILTSEYEGFPLVLAEAMSFGVIPVVYGSYSAVYDIISDGVDGVILPYNKKGYDTEFAAEKMKELMLDADKRNNLAQAAIITSKRYSVESIMDSWNELFVKL